jgi:DNA-binding NarL/FixJ family response regulator
MTSEESKIRILIADDHFIVRMGLVALVNHEADMLVVAEAADGAQAIRLYAEHRPDLTLLDTRMPVKDGIEAANEIRGRFSDARILMLTAFDGDADIRRALDAGVRGYVLKSATGNELIPALRAVAAGQRWLPREVTLRLDERKSFEALTPREVEVLNALAKGLANKQIADALQISEYTVKDHLKRILAKLRVADRTEAVTAALQRGIIHLDAPSRG